MYLIENSNFQWEERNPQHVSRMASLGQESDPLELPEETVSCNVKATSCLLMKAGE